MERCLHRAPLVAPVIIADNAAAGVIEDGGVLTCDGRIEAVGRFSELAGRDDGTVIDHEGCILTPALVNAHTHLELSSLADLGRQAQAAGDITGWIRSLVSIREKQAKAGDGEAAVIVAGRQALDDLAGNGTILVADLGNSAAGRRIGAGHGTRVLFFLEFFGMSETAEQAALEKAAREFAGEALHGGGLHGLFLKFIEAGFFCTAHAPYSTSRQLICRLKQLATAHRRLFSVHVAESVDELDFLKDGTGNFRQFLEERGAWDGSFTAPGVGAVGYLDQLGALDAMTLCVHAVHISAAEISLLAERRAKVCLCPGSNRYMGVGKAPVAEMLKNGILPALGTDSLASNSTLNIWREMRILREDHPGLDPAVVFSMATRGGAAALGYGGELGALAPGGKASFLAVRYNAPAGRSATGREVFEFLTAEGESAEICWVE